jgi:N-acetylmuramoyl-L-alanine amidase
VEKVYKIFFTVIILIACIVVCGFFIYLLENKTSKKVDLSTGKVETASISTAVAPVPVPAPVKDFNVLIIPGHDVKDGGANYGNIYERDLVATIASKMADILNAQGGYSIIVARDANNWNPILAKYFQDERQEIIDWKNKCQADSNALLSSGQKKYVPDMAFHSEVTPDMSVKLYGMNKWSNENNIDLVLNLHFNDEQRPNMSAPGDLKGFDIFIPESQMKNSAASRVAGQAVFDELKKIEAPEINDLLEDQSLIALGASGTLNAPSMLIEYSYIYEKMLRTDSDREAALNQMAQQTALGVENYFETSENK